MEKFTLKKIRKIILIIALIFLAGRTGYSLGKREISFSWQNFQPQVAVFNQHAPQSQPVDFSLFWDVWSRVTRDYLDKTKIDVQKMVWGAISGMVQSLEDPYTVFLTAKENQEAKDELGGKFEGIGAQLGMKDKKIIVIAPLPGMPAEKAGVLAGDVILKVDSKETIGWTLPEVVSKIRGAKGTKVILNVLHEGDEQAEEIEILREEIKVPSVEVEILDVPCRVAHLKLMRFGDQTSYEWEKAVEEIKKLRNEKIKGVILDMRNNPGGYLQGSVFVVSEFLKSGPVVIQEDAKGNKDTFSVNRKGKLTQVPLVVLVNKGSASASEIVAGTLKESGRAKVIGQTSFGKGSIQEAQDLPEGAGLHITTSRWLLPSGRWINEKGVEPNVIIEDDKETEKDEQLEKAVEVLCGE